MGYTWWMCLHDICVCMAKLQLPLLPKIRVRRIVQATLLVTTMLYFVRVAYPRIRCASLTVTPCWMSMQLDYQFRFMVVCVGAFHGISKPE
ncbi:hypothetical protein B0O80DRAFT_475908 [Mortierella sp. GBAus27b]|nr:hypothetical protein B0O80DRAFT_475908 [Mortierella sp. GBAus27b]